ncbi:hypothetical protein [Rhizobium laguerreae]|uniref:hypothetical protein n=1 Tax=Rhizobium laguerreae TaxID=1076926 RepID=UPI001C9096E7|nr:hypothetical protein [Rhizobium laguerreae]MBY3363735.1 hypothetical protein [Rhizobium laguerreae]
MTKSPRGQKSRTYSKRLTAWSLVGIFTLATFRDADLITAVGAIVIALNLLYMGVGHLDMRSILASQLLKIGKRGPDA